MIKEKKGRGERDGKKVRREKESKKRGEGEAKVRKNRKSGRRLRGGKEQ